MKVCPVCNESFEDQLNFCDVDGTRLAREDSTQQRNKLWSFLGAGLLVGALVISAASIFYLPRARVGTPVVNSEPAPTPAQPKAPAAETTATVAASSPNAEAVPADAAINSDVKKRERPPANGNPNASTPNPKAAALAAEDADKKAASGDVHSAAPTATRPEALPEVRTATEHPADVAPRPQPPPEMRRESKPQPTVARTSDKESNDKKKKEEEKKKGGFLRVFKKIFGKN